MAYLVGKTSVDIISDDAVDIRDNLPVGFYKLEAAPMRGFYLDKADYSTARGAKPKILNVEIFDEDSARFEKFQPVGLDI